MIINSENKINRTKIKYTIITQEEQFIIVNFVGVSIFKLADIDMALFCKNI